MTWTPSTPSLPPGSGRPTPTSARSTGSSPPPTPESSSATYTQTLRGDGLLDAGREDEFDRYMAQAGGDPETARTFAYRARPYGVSSPFDLFTEVRRYQLRDVADRIRTPLLITEPEDEQFWPGQSEQLAGLLTAPHELARFGVADGANWHCQPLGRRLTALRTFEWLGAHLPNR